MEWLWVVTLAAMAAAVAAWVVGRRAARKAAQLSDMYWQLRFDHGELKTRVDALAPQAGVPPRPAPGTQFVSLSDVKR